MRTPTHIKTLHSTVCDAAELDKFVPAMLVTSALHFDFCLHLDGHCIENLF